MDGLYLAGRFHSGPMPGAVRVDTVDTPRIEPGEFVELGRRIEPSKVLVYARNNDNTRFVFVAQHEPPCGCGVLALVGRVIAGSSSGRDDRGCHTPLELDAADASAAARFFGTVRRDRVPIGEHLVGTFTSRPHFVIGERIEVVLTITNPGAPVRWRRGGRTRGPRNDQFDFEVRRDGELLPRIDAHGLGGVAAFRPLGSGERAEVVTPLAPWADLSVAGRYEVICRYETELITPERDLSDDDTRGAVWDRTFVGSIRFEIRPGPAGD